MSPTESGSTSSSSTSKRTDYPLSIRLAELTPHVARRGSNPRTVVKRDLGRYYALIGNGVPKLTRQQAREAYEHFSNPNPGAMHFYDLVAGPDPPIRYIRLMCMLDALERAQILLSAGETTLDAALMEVGLVKRGRR